ncbi:MAG: LTA synthase family protein [Actinomycetota bacterium]
MSQNASGSGRGVRLRSLLGRRDAAYLLVLLAPLVAYNLLLKVANVVRSEQATGPIETLGLLRSDLLFNAGYVTLWIGMFMVAREGLPRRIVVVLLHAASLLVVTVTTVAYWYFESTGSTLDWNVALFYLGELEEVDDIILGSTPFYAWVALAAALLYALFGPRLVSRAVGRRTRGSRDGSPRLAGAGTCLVAVGLVAFSLIPGTSHTDRSFSLSPPVNLVATGLGGGEARDLAAEAAGGGAATSPLEDVRLEETAGTQRRNVVIISLESTRARSVTPYNEELETTPFLYRLSKESLLVERAYTEIPHTSKALTAVNCGIYPNTDTEITEAEPDGIPARCLPRLLREQGYATAYFQSATETFENRRQQVENMGFEDFTALEQMDKEGFQRANYLGYEDDIMLEPSREWLEENGDRPLFVMYDTITPHHEYLAPDRRYGRKRFAEDDVLNRYLNGVRYVDFFVKNIIEQYRDMGLYEDTIFVVLGDHGEAFGEHVVKGHDGVPYEEGLRIPLIIHDPRRWEDGARLDDAPVNQLDLAPTIVEMLGYRVAGGEYPGSSILHPLPEDRVLFASCRPDLLCLASIEGDEKYIYHFGRRPDELYDVSEDPLEKDNLAGEAPPGELERRRDELLGWRADVGATYDRSKPSTGRGTRRR